MALDKATVARIATLARIRVTEDQLEPLAGELSGILDWVEQLMAVDTENVPPMTSVAPVAFGMTLPMRDDVVSDGGDSDGVLANAPRAARGFFAVPKVVE
ncbi:MAG TPA: Asp-tRNA(Asn)/Glu-tRNA(Gln) amidotransferase subunit GatC [Stellaceae bacterium]|nr:Asp-tRNA(Asn)/Glu-tRNA(Gln) amidotransferase subunit GatC [Stellaceae bacterium]